MCGRFGFTASTNWELRFNLAKPLDERLRPSYNIAPSQKSIVITKNSPYIASLKIFGIHPHWDKSKLLINAKSETVNKKRTFSKMFRENRCLVPASFFYEWQQIKSEKRPFLIHLKNKQDFAFAGIYNLDGFVILTTHPNKLMKKIHNRMPVILTKNEENIWLDKNTNFNTLEMLFDPFPDNKLEAYQVSDLVNSPKNNNHSITKKVKN